MTLTVTDDDGATNSVTQSVTVNDTGTTEDLHIESILSKVYNKNGAYSVVVQVFIADNEGNPVPSASSDGCF